MPTEADTCRTLITPKLQAAGWEADPHSIAEQRYFTDGRIIVHGNKATRRAGKRADSINSMVEFKQIIGRCTRVRDDYGKLWFNILDYSDVKGFEFCMVIIIGCGEDFLPSPVACKEEAWREALRLYVAMTRARFGCYALHWKAVGVLAGNER